MKESLGKSSLQNPQLPERAIGLVLTGGTIASQEVGSVLSVSNGSGATEVALLKKAVKGQEKINVEVKRPLQMLSENLRPSDWIPIARDIRRLVKEKAVDGVIVFHGTDTMAYTAAALSFLLADLDKPIVLTGSNLPMSHEESDAQRNVHDALVALKSVSAGTYIAFAGDNDLPGLVHLGTRARKLQAFKQAFASINAPLVGEIVNGQFTTQSEPPLRFQHSSPLRCAVDDRVLFLRLYPGLDLELFAAAIAKGDIRGVVIELYASATGPDTNDRFSLPRFIEICDTAGVVVATTIAYGRQYPEHVYDTSVAIEEAGGLSLRDMLPETATVKLMWALAQVQDPHAVRSLMLQPIAGEISLVA